MYAASSSQSAVPPSFSYWKKEWYFLSSRPLKFFSRLSSHHNLSKVAKNGPATASAIASFLWITPCKQTCLHLPLLVLYPPLGSPTVLSFSAQQDAKNLCGSRNRWVLVIDDSDARSGQSKGNCCYFFNRLGLPPKAKLLILILNTTATFPAYLIFDSGQGLCTEMWRRQK